MKILFASSECAPFSKSGGLADVAFSLPPALRDAGNEIAVITPYYQCVMEKYGDSIKYIKDIRINLGWRRDIYCGLMRGELNGVTVWFVQNDEYFKRPQLYGYDDDKLRFAFFCKAIITLLKELDFMPDILHCNDWETALAIIYLRNEQTWAKELQGIRATYTIHNIAYQGQFGMAELSDTFDLPAGWYDGGLAYEYDGRHDVNLMKGAMLMADAVTTVSPTYAKELHYPEFGQGLQGVVDSVENKMFGILNGIDMAHYDPAIDPVIPYNFNVNDMSGKTKCKAYIQDYFGMSIEPEWPMLASVARLNEQKGIELIKAILPGLMEMGIQLVVFGQGEQRYVDYFNWAKSVWPDQIGFSSDYNEPMASRIFAGSDMYLMPSRFEPCGLSQMMAMRYGTVPIVHETGGLKDSVRPYSDFDGIGDGFSFSNYTGKDLYLAILEAVKLYFGDEEMFAKLRRRCMTKDFSWTKSAAQYNRVYAEICQNSTGDDLSFEEAFTMLKDAYIKLDAENRRKRPDLIRKDFRRVLELQIVGRGAGVMYVEFSNGDINVQPFVYNHADAKIAASLDNFLAMANGSVSTGKLIMNGQLKIKGNMAKAAEMKNLLVPLS